MFSLSSVTLHAKNDRMKNTVRTIWLLPLIWVISACSLDGEAPIKRIEHSSAGSFHADFSQDGKTVVVSTIDSGIEVWDVTTAERRFLWQYQGAGENLVDALSLSFDGNHAITSDTVDFALWSLETGEPLGLWRDDRSSIRDVAVSNGGRVLLIGRTNGSVMVFEPDTKRSLEFLGHQEKINDVDISPNGRYALTGSNDFTALLWDTRTGQVIDEYVHAGRVTTAVLDPEGRYAFTSDGKNHSQIWDLATGEPKTRLQYINRQWIFSSARFSEDGRFLLTGSPGRRLTVWDVESGAQVKQWKVKKKSGSTYYSAVVYGVAFDPETASVLASSSSGYTETFSFTPSQ